MELIALVIVDDLFILIQTIKESAMKGINNMKVLNLDMDRTLYQEDSFLGEIQHKC